MDNDADDEGHGDATVRGAARYADGPRTRMNLFTAVNAGLRAAMETDDTAVRHRLRHHPGLGVFWEGGIGCTWACT